MRKMLILAFALFLTACKNDAYTPDVVSSRSIIPEVTEYGCGFGYFYVVDGKTGVVYLKYENVKMTAISVMLNADGTPVTKEQLELE